MRNLIAIIILVTVLLIGVLVLRTGIKVVNNYHKQQEVIYNEYFD